MSCVLNYSHVLLSHCAPGHEQGMHLAILVECQCRDLLRMAKPVLLGARMQVLHYHQATTCVGKEAYR